MTMVLSEDTRHHLRAACKENLLAIRALLDLLIGEVEPAPPRAPAPPSGRPSRERPAGRLQEGRRGRSRTTPT